MATLGEHQGRRKTDYETDDGERRLRVLSVDDDGAYLRRLSLVLRRAGFDVITAPDGTSALELIQQDPTIGIVVVDLNMPGIDGIETVRRARAESTFPALYCILLTSNDGVEVKLRALDGGLDDFLPKTSSDAVIVAKLRSAARRLEMERKLHVENAELQTLALTDELTGVANRRALFRAAAEVLAAERTLSAVLFDLDRFKAINDTYGHLTGDRILAAVAGTMKEHTRYGDVIGRYGGDEFVLLLPDTPGEEAHAIARRLREKTRSLRWNVGDVEVTIAMTYGVAVSCPTDSTLLDLLSVCDRHLYDHKSMRMVAHLGAAV
jgi:two-component system cell cycle response regulator